MWFNPHSNPLHKNHHRKNWQSKTLNFSIIWIIKNKILSGFENLTFNAVSHHLPYTD